MTTRWSLIVYQWVPMIDGIQFPWRMLSVLLLIPPLLLALLYDRIPYKHFFGIGIILLMLYVRIPQTYGKNFTQYPQDHYFKTVKNLHFDSLNTIWMGKAHEYPIKSVKGEIIEGNGTIVDRQEKNSGRTYTVEAKNPIRMVDNTFYFPGWTVYVDDKTMPIEFQDMNYRGMITYQVPEGNHQIRVVFKPTKIRLISQYISYGMYILLLSLLILDYKFHLFEKYDL